MTELERFRADVEKFIADRKMKPTKFGKDIVGDPRFVFDLRNGREPRTDTRQRVLAAIRAERAA